MYICTTLVILGSTLGMDSLENRVVTTHEASCGGGVNDIPKDENEGPLYVGFPEYVRQVSTTKRPTGVWNVRKSCTLRTEFCWNAETSEYECRQATSDDAFPKGVNANRICDPRQSMDLF